MRFDGDNSNSNGNSRPFSNGAGTSPLHKAVVSNSANGTRPSSMAMNGSSSNGHSSGKSKSTDYFGHDREEVTRILIQALSDLGYNGAAGNLSQESGFDLESPTVAAFRCAVLQGDWTEAEELLFGGSTEEGGVSIHGNGLALQDGMDKNLMRFRLRQQKFLELLEQKDMGRALNVLRLELTPLYQDTAKLHFLSSLLMCTPEDLMIKADWDGANGQSRHLLLSELSRCISPSVMLPEHRLKILLDQVKQHQIDSCKYHNTATSPSLYQDHMCDRSSFPLRPVCELNDHAGEVWLVEFSHSGSRLASCGSDGTVIVYNLPDFDVHHSFADHENGVGSFAWSPDDQMIISCGQDNRARLWSVATGEMLHTLPRFSEPVSSCVWAPDGQTFVTGVLSTERNLCQWNLNGDLIYDWGQTHRLRGLAVSPDGNRLVAQGINNLIYVYNFVTRELEYEVDLKTTVCSVSISANSRYLLVTMVPSEIRMLDLDTGEKVRSFTGAEISGEWLIRSSFGGAHESFVISGSDDGHILIYHKESGTLVEKLEGHKKGCCNSISWSPTNPCMFASAGDDKIVRIWSNDESRSRSSKQSRNTNGSQHEFNGR